MLVLILLLEGKIAMVYQGMELGLVKGRMTDQALLKTNCNK